MKLEIDLIENQIRYLKVIVNAIFTSVSGWRGIDLIYVPKKTFLGLLKCFKVNLYIYTNSNFFKAANCFTEILILLIGVKIKLRTRTKKHAVDPAIQFGKI